MSEGLITALVTLAGAIVAAVTAQYFYKKNSERKDLLEAYLETVALRHRLAIDITLRINNQLNIAYHKHEFYFTQLQQHDDEQLRYVKEQSALFNKLEDTICDLIKQISRFQINLGYENPKIAEIQKILTNFQMPHLEVDEPFPKEKLKEKINSTRKEMLLEVQKGLEVHLDEMLQLMKKIVEDWGKQKAATANQTLIK